MVTALLATAAAALPAAAPPRPPIAWDPIPFPARRRVEMRAYARRHYGLDTAELRRPRVIVEHVTETPTYRSAWEIFASDLPDLELRERPGLCAHFVIDRRGTVHQLVPLALMCRHTVGLNWTAIGIEHVGPTPSRLFVTPAQRRASLRLTAWLRCREGIALRNVIGHAESLGSPYHHERVARLRTQTHDDAPTSAMAPYRRALAAYRCT